MSMSLGVLWSARCVLTRRVLHPLRFGWTMGTSWSWMVAQSECVHRTVPGQRGPRVKPYMSLGSAAHCDLSTSKCNVSRSTFVCARFGRARVPWLGCSREIEISTFVIDGPFCQPGNVTFGGMLGLNKLGEGREGRGEGGRCKDNTSKKTVFAV